MAGGQAKQGKLGELGASRELSKGIQGAMRGEGVWQTWALTSWTRSDREASTWANTSWPAARAEGCEGLAPVLNTNKPNDSCNKRHGGPLFAGPAFRAPCLFNLLTVAPSRHLCTHAPNIDATQPTASDVGRRCPSAQLRVTQGQTDWL